jgi:hypothetical protein
MANMTEPVLSLDTLVDRKGIRIDGETYGLRNPGELSAVEYHSVFQKGSRFDILQMKPEVSEEEGAEMGRLLDFICRVILDAPDEVHRKLSDTHRLYVMKLFTQLQRAAAELVGSAIENNGQKKATPATPRAAKSTGRK